MRVEQFCNADAIIAPSVSQSGKSVRTIIDLDVTSSSIDSCYLNFEDLLSLNILQF